MTITGKAPIAQIKLEGLSLPLTLKRVARARHFTLRYRPLRRDALLTLPKRASMREAIAFAESRKAWLAEQVRGAPLAVEFTEGAVIPVLGEWLPLRHAPGRRGVKREGEALLIGGDPVFFARRARDWLKAEVKREISLLAHAYAARIEKKIRRITLKDTSSRWGSCSHDGSLAFSWRMVFAPREVLEYLVAHEVAHLREMNHSPRFWRVVEELAPDWRRYRHWLRREGGKLYLYG